jgi:3-oxoacyl-[acyl-carrier-protein] synthase II
VRDPIAITGLGAVTAFGAGVEALWRGLVEGRSAVGDLRRFDAPGCYTRRAAEVPGGGPDGTHGLAAHWSRAAAREARRDARLDAGAVPAERVAVAMGTTLGGMAMARSLCAGAEAAPLLPRLPYWVVTEAVAAEVGAGGECATVTTACASSLSAIERGVRLLAAGRVDVVYAGGADALCEFVYAGFCALLALAPDRAQPFDRGRRGLVLGEGAGVCVLERLADARARGAPVRALVGGAGTASDAHHLTGPHPDGEGLRLAIERALAEARVPAAAVGYVNAHGTATPFNDRMEARALARAGGADWARRVPISSTKPATGHCLGAAGAVETIACVRALETGVVPPTLNFETPDPDCPVDCVAGAARPVPGLAAALNLAAGFGGQDAALLLRHGAAA